MRLAAATALAFLLATPAWAAQQPGPQPAAPAPVVLDPSQLDQVTAGNTTWSNYRPQFYLRSVVEAVGQSRLFVGNLSWPDTTALDSLEIRLRDVLIAP